MVALTITTPSLSHLLSAHTLSNWELLPLNAGGKPFSACQAPDWRWQRTKNKLRHIYIFVPEVVLYIGPDAACHSKEEELPKSLAATPAPKRSNESLAHD